jgi:hypothetical protein
MTSHIIAKRTCRLQPQSSPHKPNHQVKLALCQILVGDNKQANIATARAALEEAAIKGGAQVVSLPECWNGPYATASFPLFAEPIPKDAAQVGGWVECRRSHATSENPKKKRGGALSHLFLHSPLRRWTQRRARP